MTDTLPTVPHKHLSIRSDLRQLKAVREAVQELAAPYLLSGANGVILAVDEALSNVMRHGGATPPPPAPGTDAGEIDIDITVTADSGSGARRLEVCISHCGPAYDPTQAACEEPARRVLARQRGGMGISIMRRVMDEVRYTHSPGQRNELKLIKYIDRKAATD